MNNNNNNSVHNNPHSSSAYSSYGFEDFNHVASSQPFPRQQEHALYASGFQMPVMSLYPPVNLINLKKTP